MSPTKKVPISLEEAKQLVAYLEQGDDDSANALLEAVSAKESVELFVYYVNVSPDLIHVCVHLSFKFANFIIDLVFD